VADKGVEVCIDNSFALFVKSLVHPAKVRDIPFFRRSEATVDKGLLHVQNTSDPQFKGKSLQNSFHHSGADPLREPAMTGRERTRHPAQAPEWSYPVPHARPHLRGL